MLSSNPLNGLSGLEVSVNVTQTLLETFKRLGLADYHSLMQEAGLTSSLLNTPDARIPFEVHERLWELAHQASGDDLLGLKCGMGSRPGSFSYLGHMAINSATVGDALESLQQYQNVSCDGGQWRLQRQEQHTIISFDPVNPHKPSSHQRACATLSAHVTLGRLLVGEVFSPLYANFTEKKIQQANAYETFFACPVQFSASSNQLVFARSLESLAIPHASQEILEIMTYKAAAVVERRSKNGSFSGKLAQLLSSSLPKPDLDYSWVSAQLNVSPRTLQRKLLHEGTSYQQVLDDTRHKLALEHLKQPLLTVTDIASLLGFTEPSAFYRAFKRWQGGTPGGYRDSH